MPAHPMPLPPPRFDVALSLAGAVSGGAYLAGVADFLVEALDAFDAARERGDTDAPDHDTVLCAVAGASSGSLTAAVLAGSLQHGFPPVRAHTPAALRAQNPLYDAWVNMTGVEELLGVNDAAERPMRSLLDSSGLDAVARKAIDYGVGRPPKARAWIANPLRLGLSVGNLRGVPFSIACTPATARPEQTLHADVVRFAMTHFGPREAAPPRAGEEVLHFPDDPLARWGQGGARLAEAALASAAFPGALRPRVVTRATDDYRHIETGSAARPGAEPSWSDVNPPPGDTYRFAAVDGGLFNNSPVDIARALLGDEHDVASGLLSRQAILMVDPLSSRQPPGPSGVAGLDLPGVVGAVLKAMAQQLRFRPGELAVAADAGAFHRYLIAPARAVHAGEVTGQALAGNFLGGFGGYLSLQFRRHDFLLGRRNAQRYFADTFTLPQANPLFDRWTPAQRQRFATGPAGGELPIVPLVGRLHPKLQEEALPAWPAGQVDLGQLERLLAQRLEALYQGLLYRTWWRRLVYPLWRWWARPAVVRQLATVVAAQLAAHGLD